MIKETTAVDRDAVQRGDTIRWKTRPGTTSWGLADYVTAEGVRVLVTMTAGSQGRYLIKWDRVTGHWPGRAEHDRHVLP